MFKHKDFIHGDFNKRVDIFTSTQAIQIPKKLESIANAIKEYVNGLNANASKYLEDLVNGDNGLIKYFNNEVANIKADLASFIATNANSTYSIPAINSALGSGELRDITYDVKSRISGYKQGILSCSNIEYNDEDSIIKYKETKTIGIISESIIYNVIYNNNGSIKSILKET